MTEYHIHDTPARVGRKKQWTERIQLPLAEGTTAKIDSLLEKGEVRLDVVREAIDREIVRRQRDRKRLKEDDTGAK
ncbi:MAG: hypothetical protein EOS73_14325 [Mesorhizobium sp.]|uniref:hypothetical protein n=1 Tax=Mesorhizobium sp. M7A.F.Ca.ET.027.02.1.1 TaxID=2496655 RepID=UPI000FD40C36|nr:hypothetical protein [Mesorhizobium sp. M7A.F.Ca.ET.027.02.1.1]RVD07804.1 hypothetical protein EN749_34305 [Mesorhizobium sp. M7A.F.Ca.ET.027.02.1.1]RWC26268.1 MAG: hypothetical protein EOS27_25615 [Mesorhizobium sp.]RWD08643.1 MAG: hypothetical protein EOS73_14325 [Mesorhizobium sp.]